MGKEFILANIAEATRLVTEQPRELIDLQAFEHKTECGTIYCLAGILTTSAHFRLLGWSMGSSGSQPYDRHKLPWAQIEGIDCDESEKANQHFGPDAFANLFMGADCSKYDNTCQPTETTPEGDITHRALALHRLACQRELVEAM